MNPFKSMRTMRKSKKYWIVLLLALALMAVGCTAPAQQPETSEAPVDESVGDGEESIAEEMAEETVIQPVLTLTASFFPYADVARHIGGPLVEVHQLVPDGADPHSFEPSPRDLIRLETSQVFIYNGLGMEPWLEGALALLENQDTHLVEGAEHVSLLPFGDDHDHDHDHDHDDDHDHGEWDPHIWTDPLNMVAIGEALMMVYQELDPENSAVYEENFRAYEVSIKALDEDFRRLADAADQKVLLVSHAAFGYFAHRYGFQEIAVTGITPHAEPNPGRLAELTNLAREYKLEYIFFETLANPRTAEVLAAEAGLEPLMLHNLEGLSQAQREAGATYVSLMQENLITLEKALVK